MRGIVRDKQGRVEYKFDTPTLPTLEPGQYIELRDDIDDVEVYHAPVVHVETDIDRLVKYAKTKGWIPGTPE